MKFQDGVPRIVLTLALAGISSAAIPAEPENTAADPAVFVQQAAQLGLVEIESAKAALAKSEDAGIRSFAQRMVRDHSQANLELAALAALKGIEAPERLDREHQAMLGEITSRSGTAFEHRYSEHMTMGRTRAVVLFESAAKSADADIAAFAKKFLPTLLEHQRLAEKNPHAIQEPREVPGG